MILQILIAKVAGWVNRHQQQVIAYLQAQGATKGNTDEISHCDR